ALGEVGGGGAGGIGGVQVADDLVADSERVERSRLDAEDAGRLRQLDSVLEVVEPAGVATVETDDPEQTGDLARPFGRSEPLRHRKRLGGEPERAVVVALDARTRGEPGEDPDGGAARLRALE